MKTYIKKLYVLLIVCLITISPIYSQKSSTDCTVPCQTLRNAIKVKYELNSANDKILILRDSVSVMGKIIYQQDSIILNKNSEITNLNKTVRYKDSTSSENLAKAEFYKSEYNTQVKYKWIAIVVGSITTLCSLFFF